MRTTPVMLCTLAVLAAPVGLLRAQDAQPCNIVITGVARGPDTTRYHAVTIPGGGRSTYIGGGVDATCAGQGNRLLADSAEHFTDRGMLILYHNVRYSEPRVTINSDRMVYYTREERLVAEGRVRGRTAGGTRFAGPQFEYFRAKPFFREQSQWIATGRPFVRMSPTEAHSGPPSSDPAANADSTDLTADRVLSVNDSLVWASGDVIIERRDMRATSDSATLDNGIEFARLLRDPHIQGKGERPFTLDGVEIDLWSRERELQRVLAKDSAQITSDSLTLTSDTIDLRFTEQRIEQIFAWGGRALADGDGQRIESDSMDVRMPGQRLQELRAVGRSIAWSRPDTTTMRSDELDWIGGDTIVALFEQAVDSASATRTRMKQVTATGTARAYYQLATNGGRFAQPNISYNRGRQIVVVFKDGQMGTVHVMDKASGLYLEAPPPDSTATRADTTQARRQP